MLLLVEMEEIVRIRMRFFPNFHISDYCTTRYGMWIGASTIALNFKGSVYLDFPVIFLVGF